LSAHPGESGRADRTSTEEADLEPAGGRRRLVEIRCGFADLARKEAEAASARVLETKRRLAEQTAAVARAEAAIDPAATHSAKDDAHRAFRAAMSAARGRGQVEAAAIAWLGEINKINGQSRAAQAHAKHERELADALISQLAKLSSTAEASATAAASAIEACRAARADLEAGDLTEAPAAAEVIESSVVSPGSSSTPAGPALGVEETPQSALAASPSAAPPSGAPAGPPADEGPPSTDWLVIDLRSPHPQSIIRLIRRDGKAMNMLVDRLAGTDPAARSCWGLLFSNFVDAVVAAAIEDACLTFPEAHPFWTQFSPSEACEVARGLAALGFRFDGMGAFADGRVPGRRDLAMAVGSAGLLPARVHYWPAPDEAAQLFRGVTASGDAFIAAGAPALTLGELVRLLGRRAEHLADLWNDWARVRPLLFSTSL
jgi:hypothetical protein